MQSTISQYFSYLIVHSNQRHNLMKT